VKCDFENLCLYLNDKLNEEQKHEVIAHLERCDICLEAVLTMLQDGSHGSMDFTPGFLEDETGKIAAFRGNVHAGRNP
jgi:hypothetical protein